MKILRSTRFFIVVFLVIAAKVTHAQNPENWTKDQLMEPQQLAEVLKTKSNVPTIICVGPGALIPGSIDAGPAHEAEHFDSLAKELKTLDKTAPVVVYCGCCPFEHCPNVRPAIDLLKKMGFTNYKLLDLPHNIKADWMDKGYPSNKL